MLLPRSPILDLFTFTRDAGLLYYADDVARHKVLGFAANSLAEIASLAIDCRRIFRNLTLSALRDIGLWWLVLATRLAAHHFKPRDQLYKRSEQYLRTSPQLTNRESEGKHEALQFARPAFIFSTSEIITDLFPPGTRASKFLRPP